MSRVQYATGVLSVVMIFLLYFLVVPTSMAEGGDSSSVGVSSESTEIRRGKILFLQCRACHEVEIGQPHKVGPNLHGVMGRRSAAAEGFIYSEALSKSGLIWDKDTLDRWIEHPASVVPETTMAFVGIASASDRMALMAYLKAVTK